MAVATLTRPQVTDRAPARTSAAPALRARPIPVAAYPAGVPRWVTYDGRRRRVLAVHDQPGLDGVSLPVAGAARRVRVELAGGRELTLVQDSGAWYER